MILKTHEQTCQFSGKPKYECLLESDPFDLRWVYSVPCGNCARFDNGSHIYLDLEQFADWGPTRTAEINDYLDALQWTRVVNRANKRFLCPHCSDNSRLFV